MLFITIVRSRSRSVYIYGISNACQLSGASHDSMDEMKMKMKDNSKFDSASSIAVMTEVTSHQSYTTIIVYTLLLPGRSEGRVGEGGV